MLQDWLKLTGILQCCARRLHIAVAKGTNCRSLVCYRGIFLQHQTLHLGPDPLWPSLISYSVRRPGLAVRPRDINMQLVVDSNAKPHNQQIINSQRTPPSPPPPPPTSTRLIEPQDTTVPHVEKKKLSLHVAMHQASSMLWSRWLITAAVGQQRAPSRRIIFSGANGNLPGPLKIWLVCEERWMQIIPAHRWGEENRCRPSIHQGSGSAPWKSWYTGTVFPPALKAYCFGKATLSIQPQLI